MLERIPDFSVDLAFKCDSFYIPVLPSLAPNDTFKIYKKGSNLRLDYQLCGIQNLSSIKGDISVIYKGRGSGENEGELLIIDKEM